MIVQAGAFGEHRFTAVRFREERRAGPVRDPRAWMRAARAYTDRTAPVDGTYFAVRLPPATRIRLDVGLRRYVNRPTYAFPWHGGRVTVPRQEA